MAEAAIDYSYRYAAGSSLDVAAGQPRLRLATSGGLAANPRLFTGIITQPTLFADAMLAVGAVARTRFHTPPAMLARIISLADPVATVSPETIRFEAFSACASVYARLDLLPGSTDGELLGSGTTNIDLGADVRAALAGVTDAATLGIEVGLREIAFEVDGSRHIERKVALPARWVRGFVQVQAIQAAMTPVIDVEGAAFRRFMRALPRGAKHPIHVRAVDGELVVRHRTAPGSVLVADADRLRVLERLAARVDRLAVFSDADGSSAWCAYVNRARFTLVLSPEAWRGFSGEGRAIRSMAVDPDPAVLTRLRAALAWQAELTPEGLARKLGTDPAIIASSLAALAASGLVGFDVAAGAYFHRVLPFLAERVERSEPRLERARRLVAAGAVRLEGAEWAGPGLPGSDTAAELVAWVAGRQAEYRVRLGPAGDACTCPWWGRHPGDRGPCSHIVAAQIARARVEADPGES